MLHEFLVKNNVEIMTLAEAKTERLAGSLSSSAEMKLGAPNFLNLLIVFLQDDDIESSQKKMIAGAAQHGKEMLRLNYSLSHVVHSYGAICQAITEFAQNKEAEFTAHEFNQLNYCLDIAIASAVSEYQFHSIYQNEERELQHLGFLAHELRNALSSATVAHDMIKKGMVGTDGSTARVLEENLVRMRKLIDRSLSDVRMRANPEIYVEEFNLKELIDQILLSARREALVKEQRIDNFVDGSLTIVTDRHLLLSALANLIQNAIKYSKLKGKIEIDANVRHEKIIIEVRDECGGLDTGWIENMFMPFVSGTNDRSGLGLGLSIVNRAVKLLQGQVKAVDNPRVGCAFIIELPLRIEATSSSNIVVSGEASVTPDFKKKQ